MSRIPKYLLELLYCTHAPPPPLPPLTLAASQQNVEKDVITKYGMNRSGGDDDE